MKNTRDEGGLQVPDIGSQADSLTINWVKKVLDPQCKSPWKEVIHDKVFISPELTIFHCDGNKTSIKSRLQNWFWEEVAGAWHKISYNNNLTGS